MSGRVTAPALFFSLKIALVILCLLWLHINFTLKPLTVCIITNCGKFLKRREYQNILPVSWETCVWVKQHQLEPYVEQLTRSKLRKVYDKAIYSHPVYLTYTHSTSWEMLGWRKHQLESRLPGEISTTSECRWYHTNGRKPTGTEEPLDEAERREWKSWLKTQY